VSDVLDMTRVGKTQTANDSDLSMETLVQDTISVMERVLPASDGTDKPQTVLVGHRCACSPDFSTLGATWT
jgi:hypothetical protein